MDDAGQIQTHREVPAKRLATPTTVSPQLQRSISGMAAAAAAGGGLPAGWAPGNATEWKAVIAQMDAQALSVAGVLSIRHAARHASYAGVSIQTTRTGTPSNPGK